MHTEDTQFFSDGYKLAANFYWSDDHDHRTSSPMIIANSGFTGLRQIHPARFARYLTQRGHACFAFDYRGFADSEGPRHRVLLEEQVRDIMHAAAYISADERVDQSRIILLGWGMAAGLIIDAARELPGVIGLIAINGFYNGRRVQQAHRSSDEYRRFVQRVADERAQRACTGKISETDPFDIYPLDPQSREYVDNVLRKTPGYQAELYSFELADSLLRWNVEACASQMQHPLLIAHGDQNMLHPTAEAESLNKAYNGPAELYWIKDAGHTEFMHDENPTFQALGGRVADWLDTLLQDEKGA